MRRFSPKTRSILKHETVVYVSYLLPWVFVIAHKILDTVHESSRMALPRVFIKYPFLYVCCESLREVMRRPRNKIVHGCNCGLYMLPSSRFKGSRKYFFIVRDERRKELFKIDYYDMLAVVVVTRSVVAALKRNAVSGKYVYLMIDQFKYLSAVGLIPFRELLRLQGTSTGKPRLQWSRGSLFLTSYTRDPNAKLVWDERRWH